MRKSILFTSLLIVLVFGIFSRLSLQGWLFGIGILTILIFGLIHIIVHSTLIKNFLYLKKIDLILIASSHLLYLCLFLFQSEADDSRGYVVIEYIFGEIKSFNLESITRFIFFTALGLYLIFIFILLIRLKINSPGFSKKKLIITSSSIILVILLPIGLLYLLSHFTNLKEMKKDEKLGKYENLRRALKEKEKVKYLRLYKYPNSYRTIPSDVFKLYNLEELEMYSNEIEEIPEGIGQLKKLKILDLQYNEIRIIPDEISKLSNLEELVLMNNYIDSINPKICDCDNLKVFYIGGKSLKSIPKCLTEMDKLEKLVVQSDSINNFMDDFKAFSKLKELDLFTYGGTIRDNEKLAKLKESLPNTKIYIP